jgi:NADH-quinone oxidoreductase subunit C
MSDQQVDKLVEIIEQRLGQSLVSSTYDRGELGLEVRADDILSVAATLRDDADLAYDQLSHVTAVDYSSYAVADWQTNVATTSGFSRAVGSGRADAEKTFAGRFAVVYQLLSMEYNRRLRVKAFLPDDPPRIASVVEIWPGANWYEREVFDLFGILFEDHPDLRRILTDYGFIGHPFRKDFPLEGYVEVRYDPDKERVLYQPVSIENRVLVPRVIREETRHQAEIPEESDGDA